MAADTPAIPSDMAALEAFVTENDDLLALEERIGRFNIFDALEITRVELRHSNFLAWLLTPGASHGQGDLFLKALLMDMLRHARATGIAPPVSPVLLDGADLHGCDIRREWRHIDLLIVSNDPAFVVAIENKVDSGEHSGQLNRYRDTIAKEFPARAALRVFLTPDGAEASEDDWLPYSYADLHRVLSRVRRTSGGSLGSEVGVFVDQYLSLIGSRFMDDPQLDELCRRIYANHRQALQLIWDRVGSPASGVLGAFEDALLQDGERWHIFNRTSKRVDFVPRAWLDWIPPICKLPKQHDQFWIRLIFSVGKRACRFVLQAAPTTDLTTRRMVIQRLTENKDEFGFRVWGQGTDKWTALWNCKVAEFDADEEEPDQTAIAEAAMRRLAEFLKRTQNLPAAMMPIVAQAGKG
jgi:hypothetical protein